MSQCASRTRRVAYTLIAGTFACVVWPSSGALAQDDAAPAASATSATPAEPSSQSRRERRRAAQAETATAPQAAATAAPAAPAAATAPSAAAAPAATAVSDGPTTICKNIKPLGTRMAKRVCGTPEQWAAFESKTTDAASEDMRNVRSTGAVIATTPGPSSTP